METKRAVRCKNCGHVWESPAKPENITAGKIECKKCKCTDIQDNYTPSPEQAETLAAKPSVAPPLKSKVDLEVEAEKIRKAAVDKANKEVADKAARDKIILSNIPLTNEERDFLVSTAAKMNKGRKVDQPSPAEILKYSKLIERENVTSENKSDVPGSDGT